MIHCSPRELVTQPLFDCYTPEYSNGLIRAGQNTKSIPRKINQFCSPNKNEKISLKKISSLK